MTEKTLWLPENTKKRNEKTWETVRRINRPTDRDTDIHSHIISFISGFSKDHFPGTFMEYIWVDMSLEMPEN